MRKVTVYPVGVKSRVLAKALAPNPTSVVELAREFNIPYATIYSWVKNMIEKTEVPQCPQDKSAQDKLRVVIDTADNTEEEQAAYCRKHGRSSWGCKH
jgi:transposase-like protein